MNTQFGTWCIGLPADGGSIAVSEDTHGVSLTSSQPASLSQLQFNHFSQNSSLEHQLLCAKQEQLGWEKLEQDQCGGTESQCSRNTHSRGNSKILPPTPPFTAPKPDAVYTNVTFHQETGDKFTHKTATALNKCVRNYVPGTTLKDIHNLMCYTTDTIDKYVKQSDVIIVSGIDIPTLLKIVEKNNSIVSLVLLGDIKTIHQQVKTIPQSVESVLLVHSYEEGGNFLPKKEDVEEFVGNVPYSIIGHQGDVIEFLIGQNSGNNIAQILCAMKLGGVTFENNLRDILKAFSKNDDGIDPSPNPFNWVVKTT
jgi:hypothetical protein